MTEGCMEIINGFTRKPGNEHLVLFYEYFHGDTGRALEHAIRRVGRHWLRN